MFDNKFDQYRTEVCPEIEKKTFIGHIASLLTFFYRVYDIVDLSTCFRAFWNIFLNILAPICRVYNGGPRNVGLRINRGCF